MTSFKAIVGVLFFLLVAGIAVMGIASYLNNQNTVKTSAWLRHTHEVVEKADKISSVYKDVRLNINIMIIKSDTSRYAAYLEAMKALWSEINELRGLTADNSHQQRSIDSLARRLRQFKNVSDSLIALISQKQSRETVAALFSNSLVLREDVTSMIQRIKGVEKTLLEKRESANERSLAAFTRTFVSLLAGTAVLLVSTFFVVRYNFNKRRKAEEQVKQALVTEKELNKLKSSFVTLASHEFRTPLTAILSSADLLENYTFAENKEKIQKHISRIKSSVNNLTSILDEFLSVTKIEEGRVQPNLEKINIQEQLEKMCHNMREFTKPGQIITYDHTGKKDITTDPVLLANIINNLMTNAIKYSPENSPINLYSRVDGKVQVSVKDSAIGIPEEDQKHLFERFYRASNAINVQGTGLGLHIMKHYVEMLNGSVKVESEVGKGTTVEISFDVV